MMWRVAWANPTHAHAHISSKLDIRNRQNEGQIFNIIIIVIVSDCKVAQPFFVSVFFISMVWRETLVLFHQNKYQYEHYKSIEQYIT